MFETVVDELVSSLVLSSSSGPFDELAVLISWYELVNPMLNMLKISKMTCRNRMENTFITFHPLLRLRIEGCDHLFWSTVFSLVDTVPYREIRIM